MAQPTGTVQALLIETGVGRGMWGHLRAGGVYRLRSTEASGALAASSSGQATRSLPKRSMVCLHRGTRSSKEGCNTLLNASSSSAQVLDPLQKGQDGMITPAAWLRGATWHRIWAHSSRVQGLCLLPKQGACHAYHLSTT